MAKISCIVLSLCLFVLVAMPAAPSAIGPGITFRCPSYTLMMCVAGGTPTAFCLPSKCTGTCCAVPCGGGSFCYQPPKLHIAKLPSGGITFRCPRHTDIICAAGGTPTTFCVPSKCTGICCALPCGGGSFCYQPPKLPIGP